VGLANLVSESETCVGSRVRLVGVSMSFEKNFYQPHSLPSSLVRRISLSLCQSCCVLFPLLILCKICAASLIVLSIKSLSAHMLTNEKS
jgi:hypothetical protein